MLIFTRDLWAFELTSASHHRGTRGDGPAHRERFRTTKDPAGDGGGALRQGRTSHPDAQSRCLCPSQRRRHAGASARRFGRGELGRPILHAGEPHPAGAAKVNPDNYLYLSAMLFHHRRGRGVVAAQRDCHVHVCRTDAECRQPGVRHRSHGYTATWTDRSRSSPWWWPPASGGRSGDHRDHLPDPTERQRRRRPPAAALNGPDMTLLWLTIALPLAGGGPLLGGRALPTHGASAGCATVISSFCAAWCFSFHLLGQSEHARLVHEVLFSGSRSGWCFG